MSVTTRSIQTARRAARAAAMLCAALLATACLAPYGAATRGDVDDLRKSQDEKLQDIKFALSKIQADMDTQRQIYQNDAQVTIEQLNRIREGLNLAPVNTGRSASTTPVVRPGAPVGTTPAPTPAAPVRTPDATTVAPVHGGATPAATDAQPVPDVAVAPAVMPAPQPDSPERQESMLLAAKASYDRRDFDKAIEVYSAFLKNNVSAPGAPTASYYLASSYYSKQDYEAALKGYKSLLSTYPETAIAPQTLRAQAMCEERLKRYTDQRATLQKLQTVYPEYEPAAIADMLSKVPQQQ